MQRWWEKGPVEFADLIGGLTHLNRRTNGDVDAEYERFIRALKRFAKGYCAAKYEDEDRDEESPQLRKFLRDESFWYLDDSFFDSKPLRNLVTMRPRIASEGEIRKLRDKSKVLGLSEDQLDTARGTHDRLIEAVNNYDNFRDMGSRKNVGYWLAALFYLVRCNLVHGEKTPYGPDTEKSHRDATVLSATLPVLEDALLRTLELPSHRLAVYGTLRRGEPNHEKIMDLGDPAIGIVTGHVKESAGYPVYSWVLDGRDVEVELYSSERLTPGRWNELDRFEGPGYRRILVPVRRVNGSHVVATIYEGA